MSKIINLTYYGVDGSGATVKEAKLDAGRKIEHIVRECKEAPELVAVDRHAAIVAFSGYNGEWGYRLLTGEHGQFQPGPQWLSSGYPSKHDARKSAFQHLLEIVWTFDCDDAEFYGKHLAESREHGCPLNHHDRDVMLRQLLDRAAWQRRYKAYRDAGHTDVESHAFACDGWR